MCFSSTENLIKKVWLNCTVGHLPSPGTASDFGSMTKDGIQIFDSLAYLNISTFITQTNSHNKIRRHCHHWQNINSDKKWILNLNNTAHQRKQGMNCWPLTFPANDNYRVVINTRQSMSTVSIIYDGSRVLRTQYVNSGIIMFVKWLKSAKKSKKGRATKITNCGQLWGQILFFITDYNDGPIITTHYLSASCKYLALRFWSCRVWVQR